MANSELVVDAPGFEYGFAGASSTNATPQAAAAKKKRSADPTAFALQMSNGCVSKCDKELEHVTLAAYDCAECDFKDVPFCAKKGGETACSESVCNGGELSFAAGMSECVRETDGFIVPGSEKKGTCENATMTVHYEVCVDGKPEKRTRIDGC